MPYLMKEEPSNYSYGMFVKDGGATWSGVKNPLAQQHLRAVRKGDRIFYYHTGGERRVVGIARALGDACDDPGDRTGRRAVVDIAPVGRLRRPVTLAGIKALKMFAVSPLVRIPRLSVMPLSDRECEAILRLSERTG